MKRILLAATLAVSSVAFMPLQASAAVNVNIVVPIAPPPLIVEPVPAPRVDFVWAPGYWNWNGSKYVWVEGHWERARDGYDYRRAEWRREGDHWRFHEGGWKEKKHKKHKKHPHSDGFCPPGQAKKGNC